METTFELAAPDKRDIEMELVHQAQTGNQSAFDELFQQHKKFVYNVCYRMLGSSDDAVDAAQNAFIQAYRSLRRFRGEASFRSWVCRIAINICTDMSRREQRRRALSANLETPVEHPARNDKVWEAMLDLPPDLRSILVLFYFHQLSCEETAESLGISSGAARMRLHRAREAFKKRFEELE